MREKETIFAKYHGRTVGRLAMTRNARVAFQYDEEWLSDGFSISPFSLPLREDVFVPEKTHFDGLFGIFADSLPDAWGRLLLERVLKRNGSFQGKITPLDRLALLSESGAGALTYEPSESLSDEISGSFRLGYDALAEECRKILDAKDSGALDALYAMGGSSGGARPKVTVRGEDDGEWLVKFPANTDSPEIGMMEYTYANCARACGIEMMETKLFPSERCGGYFGTRRFDRVSGETKKDRRIHTATAAGLLEADFRQPCLDYDGLMKLTNILTRGDRNALEQMFRRMCFNVFAHNQDDHAKNFSFLFLEDTDSNAPRSCAGRWTLAPAYDLTRSTTYFGEHTTSVQGKGLPGTKELLACGVQAGLQRAKCREWMEEVREIVEAQLTHLF